MRKIQLGDYLFPRGGYNRDCESIKIVTKINNKSLTVKQWVYGTGTSYIKLHELDGYAILTNETIPRHFTAIFRRDLNDLRKLGESLSEIPTNDFLLVEPFKLLREYKQFDNTVSLMRRLIAEIPRS